MALSKRRRVLLAAALLALAVVLCWAAARSAKPEATLSFVRYEQYQEEDRIPRWRAQMEIKNTSSDTIWLNERKESMLRPNESRMLDLDLGKSRDKEWQKEIWIGKPPWDFYLSTERQSWIPDVLKGRWTYSKVLYPPTPAPPEAGGSPTNAPLSPPTF